MTKKIQINLASSSSPLHIKTSDELAGVLDKIMSHDADKIFLVIPTDAYIAQSVLNFQLLKRESENVGKEIVVVSEDPRIQKLASKVSLDSLASLDEGSKQNSAVLRRPETNRSREVADIIPVRKQDEDSEVTDLRHFAKDKKKEEEAEEKAPEETPEPVAVANPDLEAEVREAEASEESLGDNFFVKEYSPDKKEKKTKKTAPKIDTKKVLSVLAIPFSRMRNNAGKTALVVAGVGLFAGLFYFTTAVLPKATVTLLPKSVNDTMEFALLADSNISSSNLEQGVIPGQVIEKKRENTFTFQATGTANIEEYSTGIVRIYNEYSSSPQTLVASTRLISAGGELFRTTETVVVPGAIIESGKIIPSSIEVPVQAAEPGNQNDIKPTTFSIPGFKGTDKYLNFYGKSESTMAGGFKGTATIVTQKDLEDARNKIEEEFLSSVSEELRGNIPEGLAVLEESFDSRIETLEFDASENDRRDVFNARAVAVAETFLVAESDIENAIQRHFINSTEYSKEYQLSDNRKINYFIKEIDYDKGYVEFSAKIDQRFDRVVDTETMVEEMKGKNEIEVRKILSRATELERAQVRFWPFWVKKVPSSEEDIEIVVDYGETIENK